MRYDPMKEVSGHKTQTKRVLHIDPVSFGDMVFKFRVGLVDRIGVEVILGPTRRFYSLDTFESFLARMQKAFTRVQQIEEDYQRESREDARLSDYS